jgi:hypothetical protein
MATDDFTIRPLRRDEAALPLEWAAAEGWNPGLHDADCFYEADHDGFLVGLVDDEPVATLSVVRYGTTFGFLGLYIVRAPFRGRGYGLRIWKAGMAHLAGRNVGLDGVVAQQYNYRQSGFLVARSIRSMHASLHCPRCHWRRRLRTTAAASPRSAAHFSGSGLRSRKVRRWA